MSASQMQTLMLFIASSVVPRLMANCAWAASF